MKRILILGAGFSAPYLIHYLLQEAQANEWFITVGDLDLARAEKTVGGHPCGTAITFDINDAALRASQFEKADVVVNFLSPVFQHLVALECINYGAHMVSASYTLNKTRDLDPDANRRGILILNEMGLDPGIDHMSAMALIHRIHNDGGQIRRFLSYGGGLPAPEVKSNPFRYCITWNPRNVVRAGEVGVQYMEDGQIKVMPHHQVFHRTWRVDIDGVGTLEAYPNRDSLIYREVFGLNGVDTMIRGSLRWPGWSETWYHIVRLGLYNDTMPVPNLPERTYREFMRMFLPLQEPGRHVEQSIANYLQINPTGRIMENLQWLGLFSNETIGGDVSTPADVMTNLLARKLALPPKGRDMVILAHELDVTFADGRAPQHIKSTMVEYGKPGGFTAIAKTVGMPAAVATKLVLTGRLPITGCHIPTHSAIYEPVMAELRENGIRFHEKVMAAEPA